MSTPRLLIPGTQLVKQGVYVYECPVCKNRFRYDDPYEPMCTGPSGSRDEHVPTLMDFVGHDALKPFIQVATPGMVWNRA